MIVKDIGTSTHDFIVPCTDLPKPLLFQELVMCKSVIIFLFISKSCVRLLKTTVSLCQLSTSIKDSNRYKTHITHDKILFSYET